MSSAKTVKGKLLPAMFFNRVDLIGADPEVQVLYLGVDRIDIAEQVVSTTGIGIRYIPLLFSILCRADFLTQFTATIMAVEDYPCMLVFDICFSTSRENILAGENAVT